LHCEEATVWAIVVWAIVGLALVRDFDQLEPPHHDQPNGNGIEIAPDFVGDPALDHGTENHSDFDSVLDSGFYFERDYDHVEVKDDRYDCDHIHRHDHHLDSSYSRERNDRPHHN